MLCERHLKTLLKHLGHLRETSCSGGFAIRQLTGCWIANPAERLMKFLFEALSCRSSLTKLRTPPGYWHGL